MVPPQSRRGLPLVLLALLLVPPSLATHDPADPLHQATGLPDLVSSANDAARVDETQPPHLCGHVVNLGENSLAATPFLVELRVDDVATNATLVTERLATYQGVNLCWTLGQPLARGWHRFTLVADSGEDLPETNETNNAARPRAFYVYPAPQADLRVKMFDVYPRVARPGQYQVFHVELVNAGAAPALGSTVEFRDDTGVLAVHAVPALQPQETTTVTWFSDPSARPIGTYTAIVRLDAKAEVPELNEENNVATFAYEIPPRPLPDLVVVSAEVNGTLAARRGLRMDVTVANVGPRPAHLPVVRLLDGNVTLAIATRASLAPGDNATFQFHFVLAAGDHVLQVVADPDGAIVEMNETNNAFPVAVTILPSGNGTAGEGPTPNLIVRSLTAAPDDPSPGEPVWITALVSNAGDAPANATSLAFHADGKLLGRRPVPALGPDRHATIAFSWGTHTPGDHDLRAQVDPDNAVAEADETDNDVLAYVALSAAKPQTPPGDVTVPERPDEGAAPGEGGPGGATPPTQDPPGPADPAPPAAPQVALGELSIRTAPVPGGVKGVAVVALRNTGLDPVGRMTVAFSVDGRVVKEVLVNGLAAAASAPASSGEIDLPEGTHAIKAEVRIVGSDAPAATVQGTYEAQAGERGIPGFGVPLALLAAAVALAGRRRRA